MCTIFKVFIEFGTVLLLIYVLDFWLQGMWDLSFPIWDQTCTILQAVSCTANGFLTN